MKNFDIIIFLLILHLIITNYKKMLYLMIKVVLFIVIKITKIVIKLSNFLHI